MLLSTEKNQQSLNLECDSAVTTRKDLGRIFLSCGYAQSTSTWVGLPLRSLYFKKPFLMPYSWTSLVTFTS